MPVSSIAFACTRTRRSRASRPSRNIWRESDETKNMVDTYQRWVEGKATQDEVKVANEQFGSDPTGRHGHVLQLVPGSMLLLPIAVYGANKVGIRLFPNAFMPDEHPDQRGLNAHDAVHRGPVARIGADIDIVAGLIRCGEDEFGPRCGSTTGIQCKTSRICGAQPRMARVVVPSRVALRPIS